MALQIGINVAGQQCYLIYGMKWTILRGEGAFVTSDRGLAIHDPEPQYPWSSQALLCSPQAETTIPLSADMCLLLTLGDQQLEVREIEPAEAQAINLRTYGWANEYVFAEARKRYRNCAYVRKAARKRSFVRNRLIT